MYWITEMRSIGFLMLERLWCDLCQEHEWTYEISIVITSVVVESNPSKSKSKTKTESQATESKTKTES